MIKNTFLVGIFALILLSSCRQVRKDTHTTSNAEKIYNYIKVDNKTDSTVVQLTIKGKKVKGNMLWLPFEKDSKVGILNGTKNKNGDLNLIFDHYQEGQRSSDSLIVQLTEKSIIIKDVWMTDYKTGLKTENVPYFRGTLIKTNQNTISNFWIKHLTKLDFSNH
ncbi:hypothetical protein [Chryseobacterium polytrichastri]|uniref:Lipoprotein n=1 Tax=Chryseobacterium polytrichastri TaxID=1302687 RepID=A0A1M7L0L4_9FLAO|nr:hypothetical protein [Chryseobacterium polytrichastri]SHM71348.1 hypothetical protein SAMN05444267_10796 [Chryseobacterium polytrichastri]